MMDRRRSFGIKWGFMCLILFGMLNSKAHAQIGPAPIILVQPLGISVLKGGDAIFTVTVVSLTKPTFKWRLNNNEIGSGVSIGGVNTLVVNNVQSANAGAYSVEVKNAAGTVVSSNAFLLIVTEPVSSVVNILGSGMTTNGFRLQLSGPAGSNYVIQASSNLGSWTPISTNAAPSGTVDFTDTQARNFNSRFYRVVVR